MSALDIPKLNQIFGLQVDICRYCGGKCEMFMRECDRGEVYPYSECPSCKQTMRGYQGMLWIWKEENG